MREHYGIIGTLRLKITVSSVEFLYSELRANLYVIVYYGISWMEHAQGISLVVGPTGT